MIGWCPSFRVGVAVKPTTYLAFTCRITCSKVKADMWWHSSTITWPYSATKSLTSSFRYILWMTSSSTQPVRSIFPHPTTLLVGKCVYVVDFVDIHLAVLSYEVPHLFFSVQTLDDGDIYAARPVHFSTADMPNRFGR